MQDSQPSDLDFGGDWVLVFRWFFGTSSPAFPASIPLYYPILDFAGPLFAEA